MTTGKGNAFITSFLELIFNGTTIANIAENASVSPITNIYASLHTADPGAAGNQTTSEAGYTSYARVAVARTGSGWSISGQQVTPIAAIQFPQATGGSETETYFQVGTASSGAGEQLWHGPISPTIAVSNGVTPILTTATSIGES
jgi:hypothetical protein